MSGKNARTVKKLQERRYPYNLIDSISESFFESEESFPEDLEGSVEYVISSLSPVEQAVIKLRFGAFNNNPVTLDVISKELCLTRERIRQIEAKALRKLRHPSRFNRIRFGITGYYERLIQGKVEDRLEDAVAEKIKNMTSKEIEIIRNPILAMSIRRLEGIDLRTFNCLNNAEIHTYYDLAQYSAEELKNIPCLGLRSWTLLISACEKANIPLKDSTKKPEEKSIVSEAGLDEYVDLNKLSIRACNCLYKKDVRTYRDLVKLGIKGLRNIRNVGEKTIMEIVGHCAEKGIVLK